MEEPKSDIQSVAGIRRVYLKAKESGTLRQYYLDRLIRKCDRLDDLPDFNVCTLPENHPNKNKYKCQATYIAGLRGTLEAAVRDGEITDSELIEEIRRFREHPFNAFVFRYCSIILMLF